MRGLIIRPYRDCDAGPLADLFHRAVRDGTRRHYTARQRAAWSPAPPAGPLWEARLAQPDTVVAETAAGPAGFMTLNLETGYLDFAYVAPEMRGHGVAEALYAVLEGRARARGVQRLETEASRLAERFFLRRGWQVVLRQRVERNGIRLPNARMEKHLQQPDDRAA